MKGGFGGGGSFGFIIGIKRDDKACSHHRLHVDESFQAGVGRFFYRPGPALCKACCQQEGVECEGVIAHGVQSIPQVFHDRGVGLEAGCA